MIIVSDTSPINYLVLIGHIDILGILFEKVIIPQAVRDEMQREKTPATVKGWVDAAPSWLEVRQADTSLFTPRRKIGDGEREAIALAKELCIMLIDDRDGIREATENNLTTIGTVAVLERAAEKGLLDLTAAIAGLSESSFRLPPVALIAEMLARAEERKKR